MTLDKEILWNKTLKLGSRLRFECLNNKHSYTEEIKISVPDGLTIETVIGGRENGLIVWTLIYPGEDFVERIAYHTNQVIESYKRASIIKNIP